MESVAQSSIGWHDIAAQSQQEMPHTAEIYPSDQPLACSVSKAAWQADSPHVSVLITYTLVSRPACFASYDVQAQAPQCRQDVLHKHGLTCKMSPDGRSLVYAAQEGDTRMGVRDLRVISFDTSTALQLPDSAWPAPHSHSFHEAFMWSPSGTRITTLMQRLRVHDASNGAILLDSDAEQHMLHWASHVLCPSGRHPWCWRGDESVLVLHAVGQDSRGFCISEVRLSEVEANVCVVVVARDVFPGHAEDAAHCSKLQVSPSGQQVAMTIQDTESSVTYAHSACQIGVLTVTAVADLPSGTIQACEHPESSSCLWSPCSRYLAFVQEKGRHCSIFISMLIRHIIIFDLSSSDASAREFTSM